MIEYVAFYDYIAEELCINKEEPSLQCNGKCHLVKELNRTTESDENQNSFSSSQFQFSVLFFEDLSMTTERIVFPKRKKKLIYAGVNNYSFIHEVAIFKPPILS